jgi:signal transduction histidine kinase
VILLLRYVVIASAAYLLLAGGQPLSNEKLLYVAIFAASNLALSALPARVFHLPQFGPLLLLVDTAVILFGLSWNSILSQELLVVYFFTIFLTTVGESLGTIALGGALTSGLYGYWLWVGSGQPVQPEMWLRLPFLFLIAVFYAALTEQLKVERRRREVAEDETAYLRLLLDLAGVFSERHVTHEVVRETGRVVEQACPGLTCMMMLRDHKAGGGGGGRSFELRTHGKHYGELIVQGPGGRDLSQREKWVCQMVAHAAAGALYAAEQSDAAKTASESKEQFLSAISHELRTPLHAILGYSEILDLTLADGNGGARDSVERLRVNACRLQDLIEQLLNFAEVRAGNRVVIPEQVSMSAVIEELEPITRGLLAGKPVKFEWSVDTDADDMVTDRRMLRQVLMCLLNNATKFTRSGCLGVKVCRDGGDWVQLAVWDTGEGIPKEDVQLVFEAFKQADASLTRRYDGLGIGLTLAHELVSLMGGTVDLESEIGVGTTVRVRLPVRCGKSLHQKGFGPEQKEQAQEKGFWTLN